MGHQPFFWMIHWLLYLFIHHQLYFLKSSNNTFYSPSKWLMTSLECHPNGEKLGAATILGSTQAVWHSWSECTACLCFLESSPKMSCSGNFDHSVQYSIGWALKQVAKMQKLAFRNGWDILELQPCQMPMVQPCHLTSTPFSWLQCRNELHNHCG